jgi:hypothetical protein
MQTEAEREAFCMFDILLRGCFCGEALLLVPDALGVELGP